MSGLPIYITSFSAMFFKEINPTSIKSISEHARLRPSHIEEGLAVVVVGVRTLVSSLAVLCTQHLASLSNRILL